MGNLEYKPGSGEGLLVSSPLREWGYVDLVFRRHRGRGSGGKNREMEWEQRGLRAQTEAWLGRKEENSLPSQVEGRMETAWGHQWKGELQRGWMNLRELSLSCDSENVPKCWLLPHFCDLDHGSSVPES